MSSNPLVQLHSLGQSVWLDQMRRSLLTTGALKRLIDNDGLRGLTSNPTIFEKAISGSQDYAEQLGSLARAGSSIPHIYEELVLQDIGGAADTFRGVYDANDGGDGFVSLEVSPLLANDTKATIEEAKKLFSRLNRPHVMIKVPGTAAGQTAIEELIASGLNINVTLIFRPEAISSSIAGSPAAVPGTLIITFGRFSRENSFLASSMVALVSLANSGETSRLTNPSPPSLAS